MSLEGCKMEWFVIWAGINFLIGYTIGKPKNQAASSGFICILLGPIGWIISALAKGDLQRCPHCAEEVRGDARVCRFCHRDLPNTPIPAKRALSPRARAVVAGAVVLFLAAGVA